MKKVFILLATLLILSKLMSAQIASWNWASAPANYNETGTLSNITASALSVSSGSISFISGSNSVSVSSWSTSTNFNIGGKYWQISLTPNTNFQTSISSFSFDAGRSGTGPQSITVQYSLDAFASSGTTILNGANNANTSTLTSISANLNLPISPTTGTITFRIWGYNASSTGNFRINNISISGNTSSSLITTNYYLKSSGYCNILTSWTDDSTLVGGNSPANFSALNQVFNIRNQSNPSINANWDISGIGSTVILGDSIHPINFTVPDNAIFSSSNGISVGANSTLTLNNNSIPSFSYVSVRSTVIFGASSGNQNITQGIYGNLSLIGSGSRVFPSGTINIYGSFDPGSFSSAEAGTINFAGASGQIIPAFIYYNLSSDNYSRTFAEGTIGIFGTFNCGNANYTVGNCTINFCGSTVQSIPVLPVASGSNYYNLCYSGSNKATLAESITVANDVTVFSGVLALTNSTKKTLTINGNLILNGGTLDFASSASSAAGQVDLKGNLQQTALFGTITSGNTGNGLLNFCGNGTINTPQTISLNTSNSLNYTNITVATNTTVKLLSNLLLRRETAANSSYKGILTVNGILDADVFTYNGGINNNTTNTNAIFILNAGATLITNNTSGIQTSIGSINLNRTFNAGANYIFNAVSSTAFPDITQQSSFGNPNNIQVNANISLNRNCSISGTLTILNNVILNIKDFNVNIELFSGTGSLSVNSNTSLVITGRPNNTAISGDNTLYFDNANNTIGQFTLGDGIKAATATIGSTLNIKPGGFLNFGASGTLDLFTGNNIKLKSASSSTAAIGNTYGGNIHGSVCVERYVNANTRRFRFFGFPFTSGVTLSDYRDDIWISGPGTGSGALNSNNYNSNGFHYTLGNDTSLFYFNESKNSGNSGSRWQGVDNINQNLYSGIGYRLFYRGPISQGIVCINGSKAMPQSGLLSASGIIKTGIQNFSLSCSNGCINVAGAMGSNQDDGWNLIANPYPASIDWNATSGWTKSNVKNTIWIWNPQLGSYGNFDGITQINNVSGIIASGQAFFVRADGSNPTLSCSEAVKINGTPSSLFKTNKSNYLNIQLKYDSLNSDECVIRFMENKNDSFDAGEDVIKLMNTNLNIYSKPLADKNVSVNYLNQFDENKSYQIKLGIKTVQGKYQLLFNETESFGDKTILLLDHFLNTIIDIKANPIYKITITSDSLSQDESRFELLFNNKTNQLKSTQFKNHTIELYPNPVHTQLNVSISGNFEPTYFEISSITGEEISKGFLKSNPSIELEEIPAGMYFLHITDCKGNSEIIKFVKD